jgi:hypothetical protein
VEDFVQMPEKELLNAFDKPIISIWQELEGISRLDVVSDHSDLQSMQATRSFTEHTNNRAFLFSELSKNIESACSRLIANDLYSNCLSIFIKVHIKGQKWGKYFSATIPFPYYSRDVIYILNKCDKAFDSILDSDYVYKSTGVHFFNLHRREDIPLDMFGEQIKKYQSEEYLNVYSSIKNKHGSGKIMLASSVSSSNRRADIQKVRDAKDNYIYGLPLAYLGEVI